MRIVHIPDRIFKLSFLENEAFLIFIFYFFFFSDFYA